MTPPIGIRHDEFEEQVMAFVILRGGVSLVQIRASFR
jgi:hypothetical protein